MQRRLRASHNAESAVIKSVTRAAVFRAFAPKMAAMVRADISLEAAIVVGAENIQNPGFSVTITVGDFRKVTIVKMLYVADVGKSNAVTMLADDCSDIVFRVGIQASGAKSKAVIRIIYHAEEVVNRFGADHQTRESENVPGGIVHMNGHFDIAFVANRHELFQEVFQIVP